MGLVYLRPVRLAGVQVDGPLNEAAGDAWWGLSEWIVRKSLSREVEIGYGLITLGDNNSLAGCRVRYQAAIKLPPIVTPTEANELCRAQLPGGAYLRRRFSGPASSINEELSSFLDGVDTDRNLRIDSERPLVTVLLDVKTIRKGDDIRSNLLIPVLGAEMRASSDQAA